MRNFIKIFSSSLVRSQLKTLYSFLSAIIILSGCSQSSYEYDLEETILECFYQHHIENDINVQSSIDQLESILIKHEILKDNTGESYIYLIEQLHNIDEAGIDDPDLIEDINSIDYIPSGLFCTDSSYSHQIDTVEVSTSKIFQLMSVFDTIRVNGNISPALIVEQILDILNASDFEHEFYKTLGLIMIKNLIQMNEYDGLTRKLPSFPKDDTTDVNEDNLFVILVNHENKILAEGEPIQLSDLKDRVKDFILETSEWEEVDLLLLGKQRTSKGVISLHNDRATSYEFYISVLNELEKAYKEIRNKYSEMHFNASFENLDEEKQDVIRKLVPQRISEHEPGI